jgi:sporulation protein YlmC with PRC-barrel domain
LQIADERRRDDLRWRGATINGGVVRAGGIEPIVERNGVLVVANRAGRCRHDYGAPPLKGPEIPRALIHNGRKTMLKSVLAASAIALLSASAFAASAPADIQTSIPQKAVTVTDWYKQDVYDPNNNKIGQVMDVLVDGSGKVATLIVGVGGFLGVGEKDVAVAFDQVQATPKNNKMLLVMNTTKDSLKSAPGFKYDSTTTSWVPDNK